MRLLTKMAGSSRVEVEASWKPKNCQRTVCGAPAQLKAHSHQHVLDLIRVGVLGGKQAQKRAIHSF